VPEFIVAIPEQIGLRLDHFLVRQSPDISRAAFGHLIRSGAVLVNEQQVKAGYRLHEKDTVTVSYPEKESTSLLAQPVEFGILYEDDDLLVINKPAGLVVHPGVGNRQGTLVNGLLYRYPSLPGSDPERPGIVHRLDKDTSGVLLVAKSETALRRLGESFKNRLITKTYHALLLRHPGQERGRLVAPVGRHPVNRKKMAIRHRNGRYAATNWQVKKTWPGFCFVEINLETGRTHQIRVHLSSLGSPVAGDRLYGGRVKGFLTVARQLLHASTLCFSHPVSGEKMQFTAPLPEDMQEVISALNKRIRSLKK
jgi:23S rRNA pseudouridine1911/1915/1917 synthase